MSLHLCASWAFYDNVSGAWRFGEHHLRLPSAWIIYSVHSVASAQDYFDEHGIWHVRRNYLGSVMCVYVHCQVKSISLEAIQRCYEQCRGGTAGGLAVGNLVGASPH